MRYPIDRLRIPSIQAIAAVAAGIMFHWPSAGLAALPPDQLFDRLSPGVWSVRALAADERLLASATAVAIAPGKVVTSCRVLARASKLQLRRGNTIFDATLELPDVARDLCQLDVPGLQAPAPERGTVKSLRTGRRVYVIGFGVGKDAVLGEGLVSAVHESGTDQERIQTTIPASPGLLGAGLFDEDGKIVGVITASPREAAGTAFAVPADWLAEMPERAKAALAARNAPAQGASARAPAPAGSLAEGTAWVYAISERTFSRRNYELTVQAFRVSGGLIEEAITGTGGARAARRTIDSRQTEFVEYLVRSNTRLVVLAPYLLLSTGGKAPVLVTAPTNYPRESPGLPSFNSTVQVLGWEDISVPAGKYKALHVVASGERGAQIFSTIKFSGRFQMDIWYAPDVMRFVRLEHKVWTESRSNPELIANEIYELVAYKPPN